MLRKKILSILIFASVVGVLLLLLEWALHIGNYPPSPAVGWRWSESPYRGPMNQEDHAVNQLGLRGQKIEYAEDDFVVLLVGDSQTEAGTLQAHEQPEQVLQQVLRKQLGSQKVKVFSIASAGWGSDQQLVWLHEYFQSHRANLVLHWITPVNDYWENTFIDRSVTTQAGRLKNTYTWQDNQLKQIVPFRFDWKLRNLAGLAIGRSAGNPQFTLEQFYSDRWQKALPASNLQASDPSLCSKNELDQSELIESFVKGNRHYTLVTDEDIEHGRSHFTPFLKQQTERDQYAIQITHHLIENMAQLSKEKGAQFKIFHAYRSDLDAAFREIDCVKSKKTGQYYAYDGSDWLRHLKQSKLNEYLWSVHLDQPFPMNRTKGDWHFSVEGNQVAMMRLAEKIWPLLENGALKN
jgi:hypothetical protein